MAVLGIALALFVPLAVIGGIAALVYYLVRGGPQERAHVTMRMLLRAYLRFAYLVSLVVFLVGAVSVLTPAFATAFGKGFSYTPQVYPCPAVSPVPGKTPGEFSPIPCNEPKDTREEDDLIRGVSLLVAGLVLGGGHRLGLAALEAAEERRNSGLARAEALLATVGFGLTAIIAIPWAVYLVLHYALLGTASSGGGTTEPPGGALAVALAFTPAWAYYLAVFVRRVRAGAPAPA